MRSGSQWIFERVELENLEKSGLAEYAPPIDRFREERAPSVTCDDLLILNSNI